MYSLRVLRFRDIEILAITIDDGKIVSRRELIDCFFFVYGGQSISEWERVNLHEAIMYNDGRYVASCVRCGELTEVYCSPYVFDDEFDPDMHYCGRSPRCCP